jgi:hypothetical protein
MGNITAATKTSIDINNLLILDLLFKHLIYFFFLLLSMIKSENIIFLPWLIKKAGLTHCQSGLNLPWHALISSKPGHTGLKQLKKTF